MPQLRAFAVPLALLAFAPVARAEEPWPPAAPAPATPATPSPDPWGAPPPVWPPPAAPAAPAPADPWASAPAPVPAALPVPTIEAEVAGRETRETWSPEGLLVRRLVFDGGRIFSETTFTYDASGHTVEERTQSGASVTVQGWTHNADGTTATHTVVSDGVPQLHEVYTYEGGDVLARAVTTTNGTSVTRYTYVDGEVVRSETRAADGSLVARTVADRPAAPPAPVKVDVGINGGVATSSDVRTTSITAGFKITRKPAPSQYDFDPVEFSAFGTYNRASSQGELTNDQLDAGVGFDYNELVGPVSAFLFTSVERNPVANLDIDLMLAPIGAKYDILQDGPFTWDISVAPVWNYRSVALDAGEECDAVLLEQDGHCTYSKIRGSVRTRAKLTVGKVKIGDTLEFLPTLNPDGDFGQALEDEAIVRNTTTVEVQLTGHLSLSESLVFTRDPLLKAQADCSADPDNLLCDGMSLQNSLTLALTYSF